MTEPTREAGEEWSEFLRRCLAFYKRREHKTPEQRAAEAARFMLMTADEAADLLETQPANRP